MTVYHAILLAGYALNALMIIFLLFFEENNSVHRFTWILLLGFLPLVGVLCYILFSGNFFTRTKRMLRANQKANNHFAKTIETQERNLDTIMQSGRSEVLEDYGSLIRMNMRYGRSPLLSKNSVRLFRTGEEKFQALFAEIQRAKESVHLSYFIINNDETGKELIRILARKASEGVTVRFLYDHVGSLFTSRKLFKPLIRAGGKVSRFFPLSLINPFSINYRNHRKIVVIDGMCGYFGGMNVGDEYANRNNARNYFWRDLHVRITGPAVRMLQKQFLVDWYTSTIDESSLLEKLPIESFFPESAGHLTNEEVPFPPDGETRNVAMQVVTAGPDDNRNDEIRDAMIHMITRAKKSVYIESPYFTPDESFRMALKIAALSGIDVQIIVPGQWDKWYCRLAAMPYVSELMSYGVRFWFYNGFIHSKMLVIDNIISTIGSTNMDTRSFSLHFELNAFFYSDEFGQRCGHIFMENRAESREVTEDFFRSASIFRKGLWNFFKLFAPLM
jgi:cardiolipin synthase